MDLIPQDWADLRSASDEELGMRLLAQWVVANAANVGIPEEQITPQFANRIIRRALTLETKRARVVPVEKALHKAAQGEFAFAGRMLREHLIGGAQAICDARQAAKARPILRQRSDFGKAGARTSRETGAKTREQVNSKAKEILKARRTRPPTQRELAALVAAASGMKPETVRSHLRALDLPPRKGVG